MIFPPYLDVYVFHSEMFLFDVSKHILIFNAKVLTTQLDVLTF